MNDIFNFAFTGAFPLEDPIYVFTLALAAFLFAPLIIKRFGQPGIVGIVLVGVAIGPNGIGLVEHVDAIELLGTVGLVYLLFTVGLELNLQGFIRAPEQAALFGLTSFFLPLTVGIVVCMNVLGFDFWPAALLSAVFASHTLLAYPIVNRYDVTQNRAVTAVFGGILFTDTLALTILAIVVGVEVDGGFSPLLLAQVFGSLAILFAVNWFLIPPIARWFFQNLSEESYFEFLFVLVVVFAAGSFAQVLDIDPILGAFVAGVAFNRLISRGGTLINRIEFVGNAFFIPFFLLHVGMLVDVRVILDGLSTIEIAVAIIGTMVITKAAAAGIVATVLDLNASERGVMFGLSTGQAAAALAITLIGFDAGLFGADVLNAVVLMLLVTAVISPWLTERYSREIALGGDVELQGEGITDPRILLPMAPESKHSRKLLEFGFAMKEQFSTNPIHLLAVIRPQWGGPTEAHVANVESELADLAEFGDAAEVPVSVETRINHNVASGIVRGITETRADQLIIGWNATRSFGGRLFGNIIDQVLRRTNLPVFVTHFGHPVNTTKRLFVFLPPGIGHHDGFYEGLYAVKNVGENLGTPITVYTFPGDLEQYRRLYDLVEMDVDATFEAVDGWGGFDETLSENTEENDLVMIVSARKGEIGWHDELAALPNQLIELPPQSFIVYYCREDAPGYDAQFLRFN